MSSQPSSTDSVILREPTAGEGQAMHALVRQSPPLDLNSAYCYFLLARHFRGTCVVAEHDGRLVGCVTAYLRPDEPGTLFVWQVAVRGEHRGRGAAGRMLDALLARPACRGVRYLETTVGPGNHASRRCFERLADARRCPVRQLPFLEPNHFGPDSQHEAEVLLRIGPFPPFTTT
ncbi:MAG: diaminobutyrate acetyltransferase [Lentisphaerae bacterium]|jgi:L-2,4-diaminobutyric acid acetyltransferase|nr:diaminobutyrate acetyltransferase [Lentisphaerota bacterium]